MQYSVSGTKSKRYDETENGYGFRDIELGYIHCPFRHISCFGTTYRILHTKHLVLVSVLAGRHNGFHSGHSGHLGDYRAS